MKKLEIYSTNSKISDVMFERTPQYKLVKRVLGGGVIIGLSAAAYATYIQKTGVNISISEFELIDNLFRAGITTGIISYIASIIAKKINTSISNDKMDEILYDLINQADLSVDVYKPYYIDEQIVDKNNRFIVLYDDENKMDIIYELTNPETGKTETYIYEPKDYKIIHPSESEEIDVDIYDDNIKKPFERTKK